MIEPYIVLLALVLVADEVEKRLNKIRLMGKIRRFERLKFETVQPDDILKEA